MSFESTKNLTNRSKTGATTAPSFVTTYQAGVVQAAAHRGLQKICDDILRPYGLTKMHWMITGTILDAGPNGISITDLAGKLSTKLPYLTNTINLLESKGMLKRQISNNDERTKLVVVSDRYIATCKEIEQTMRRQLRTTIYRDISRQEFEIYMSVVYKLSDIDID